MNKLKYLRIEKGMTQFELAKLSNISQTDICRIENGDIRPYPGWRQRLAQGLGVSENEIFPEEANNGK